MHIKVRGGTIGGGDESLCTSCKFAYVVKGRSLKEQIIQCYQLNGPPGIRVPFPVKECSVYLHRNQQSVREMETIAWILVTDDKKKQIGFMRHRDLEKERQWKATSEVDDE